MFRILIVIGVILFICLLLVIIRLFCIKKERLGTEILSSFECGFDYSNKIRSFIRIRFFLFIILFLIFDVELVLILPYPVSIVSQIGVVCGLLVFFLVMISGLLKE